MPMRGRIECACSRLNFIAANTRGCRVPSVMNSRHLRVGLDTERLCMVLIIRRASDFKESIVELI